ncbi:MAG: Gfo/Idh/MocA family protein [Anaerolineae bacterium]
MSRVRVGFLGLGGMGQHHLKTVSQIPDAEIVAVCDVNTELAQKLASEHGVPHYRNHQDMLSAEQMDALYVVIPPFAHTDAELIAAGKGIHLFVEKPVALDMGKAREVSAAIRQAGVLSAVGYTLRYFAGPTVMRRYLADKTLAMIVATRWGGVPPSTWWGVMARSGGQLVEQTTHQVDLIRYMTGKEITHVYADYSLRLYQNQPGWDIPDVYSVAMRLDDGTPVSLTTSCTMHKGGGDSAVTFLLDGSLVRAEVGSIVSQPDANPDIDGKYGEEVNIDQMFIDAIRLKNPSLIRCDYDDAMRTLAATLAANESAVTGKPVEVQLS